EIVREPLDIVPAGQDPHRLRDLRGEGGLAEAEARVSVPRLGEGDLLVEAFEDALALPGSELVAVEDVTGEIREGIVDGEVGTGGSVVLHGGFSSSGWGRSDRYGPTRSTPSQGNTSGRSPSRQQVDGISRTRRAYSGRPSGSTGGVSRARLGILYYGSPSESTGSPRSPSLGASAARARRGLGSTRAPGRQTRPRRTGGGRSSRCR